MKKISFIIFSIILFFAFGRYTPSYAADSCQTVTVHVNLSATDPTVYHIVGTLCNADEGTSVQLLLSGATYNHIYWDFPLSPKIYSYTQNMQGTDFASFNIDRIGTGLSDHPDPELITIQSNAFVAHQIVQNLRNGDIGGKAFSKVVLVGHSMGSAMAIDEAATYQDVDGVVLTGYIHGTNSDAIPVSIANIYPGFLDPHFSPTLPPGYLTTIPGGRKTLFYYAPTADPTVIAEDEATKDLVTDATLDTFFPSLASHESNSIHVPVLLIVGQFDFLLCDQTAGCTTDGIQTSESGFFDPSAQLEVHTILNTGHDLNLHPSAPITFGIIRDWLKAHFDD